MQRPRDYGPLAFFGVELDELDKAVAALNEAYDADEMFWTEQATGQDSEALEHSGYLAGYRDALAAVRELLTDTEPGTLANYVAEVTTEAQQNRNGLAALLAGE